MTRGRCSLCDTDQEVRFEVIRFRLLSGFYFESSLRCVDRRACRVRVEAAGMEWDVIDPVDLEVVLP